jgi:hypothetical protein
VQSVWLKYYIVLICIIELEMIFEMFVIMTLGYWDSLGMWCGEMKQKQYLIVIMKMNVEW